MGRQQAGVDVPDPGRPQCNRDRHTRCKFMAERIVVKNGANTYEFTYGDYKDWNNPLNPAEALYAGKMTEKKNGTVVRDITTTLTGNGTDVCRDACSGKRQGGDQANESAPNWTLTSPAAATQTAAVATPRLANGKPDMTGNWGNAPLLITG